MILVYSLIYILCFHRNFISDSTLLVGGSYEQIFDVVLFVILLMFLLILIVVIYYGLCRRI